MRPRLPLLFLLCCAAIFAGSALWLAPQLPERAASHFGIDGRADGWMSRREMTVFLFGFGMGISAFIVSLFSLLCFLPSALLNVPRPDYWRSPEHYPEACRILRRWSYALAGWHLLWSAVFNYQIVAANRLHPPHLAALGISGRFPKMAA